MQKKVMKINEYPDGDSYWRIACDCGDPHHDVELFFEINDKDYPEIALNLTMEMGARERIQYSDWTWVNYLNNARQNIFWRFSTAFKVLFTGYIEMSGDVILDEDGINAMKMALDEGINHCNTCFYSKKPKIPGSTIDETIE